MARRTEKVGTGITERELTVIDPENLGEWIDVLRGPFGHFNIDVWLVPVEAELREAAHAHGLPVDLAGECTPVEYRPYEHIEWYIYEALWCVIYIREGLKQQDEETKMLLPSIVGNAFRLGSLLTEMHLKFSNDPLVKVAQRVQAGGRKGAEILWGSPDATMQSHATLRMAFEGERARGLTKMQAYLAVARKHTVGRRTVERAVAGNQLFANPPVGEKT